MLEWLKSALGFSRDPVHPLPDVPLQLILQLSLNSEYLRALRYRLVSKQWNEAVLAGLQIYMFYRRDMTFKQHHLCTISLSPMGDWWKRPRVSLKELGDSQLLNRLVELKLAIDDGNMHHLSELREFSTRLNRQLPLHLITNFVELKKLRMNQFPSLQLKQLSFYAIQTRRKKLKISENLQSKMVNVCQLGYSVCFVPIDLLLNAENFVDTEKITQLWMKITSSDESEGNITASQIESISDKFMNITHLGLRISEMTPSLQFLRRFALLTHLSLSGNPDQLLNTVLLPNLKSCSIAPCSIVTFNQIKELLISMASNMPKLTQLRYGFPQFEKKEADIGYSVCRFCPPTVTQLDLSLYTKITSVRRHLDECFSAGLLCQAKLVRFDFNLSADKRQEKQMISYRYKESPFAVQLKPPSVLLSHQLWKESELKSKLRYFLKIKETGEIRTIEVLFYTR